MCASQGVDIGDLRHRIPRTPKNKKYFFFFKKKKKMFEGGATGYFRCQHTPGVLVKVRR